MKSGETRDTWQAGMGTRRVNGGRPEGAGGGNRTAPRTRSARQICGAYACACERVHRNGKVHGSRNMATKATKVRDRCTEEAEEQVPGCVCVECVREDAGHETRDKDADREDAVRIGRRHRTQPP